MTPADIAAYAANGIADGRFERLPRLTTDATPEFARDLLEAYYLLRDRAEACRAQEGASMGLRDRIALASVLAEINDAIRDARTWLSCTARRGGRGLLVLGSGAGRSPADKGHGCPAFGPAVGPAAVPYPEAAEAAAFNGGDITIPNTPVFCGSTLQKLPGVTCRDTFSIEGEKTA